VDLFVARWDPDAMVRKDSHALAALNRDRMMILGTTEILN
jgi:hypothetical protein